MMWAVVLLCLLCLFCLKLKLLEGQNNVAFCHNTSPSSSRCSCSKHRYGDVLFFICTFGIQNGLLFLELRAVPTLKSRLHPIFLGECTESIRMCKNLKRFHCTVPNILAIFLPSLQEKSRLEHMRVHASLSTNQTKMLTNFAKLESLVLESATWNVVDLLPSWAGILQKTLTCLTLYVSIYTFLSCDFSVLTTRPFQMVNDLNECVMESALPLFTKLIGLHIVGCPKIDHVAALQLTFHVPLLESLSLTTSVSCQTRILSNDLEFLKMHFYCLGKHSATGLSTCSASQLEKSGNRCQISYITVTFSCHSFRSSR